MSMDTGRTNVVRAPDQPVVVLGGEYEFSRVDELRDVLFEGPPTSGLVIDMSEVTFIDSSALGVFVEARVAVEQAGGRITVQNLRPAQLRLFEITGMTGFFGIE